jgi:hypothetical protein
VGVLDHDGDELAAVARAELDALTGYEDAPGLVDTGLGA